MKPSDEGYRTFHSRLLFEKGLSFSGFERDLLWMSRGDGTFLDVSSVSGADSPHDGRAALAADFDDDGDSDLFVHNIQRARHQLFRNNRDPGEGGPFLKVRVAQDGPNPEAIGAIVRLAAGGRTEARLRTAGGGFASQDGPEIVFGLGDARSGTLEVLWPGGPRESFGTVRPGQRVVLRRGAGRPEPFAARPASLPDPLPPGAPRGVRIAIGEPLPDVSTKALDGTVAPLVARSGRPLVVNFWATWCVPCRKELPELEKLARELGGAVDVVAVSLEPGQDARVRKFLEKTPLTLPVSLADEALVDALFHRDNLAIPTTFLVREDGTLERVFQGEDAVADLARWLGRAGS